MKLEEFRKLEDELFRLCRMKALAIEDLDFKTARKIDRKIEKYSNYYLSTRCEDIIFVTAKKQDK